MTLLCTANSRSLKSRSKVELHDQSEFAIRSFLHGLIGQSQNLTCFSADEGIGGRCLHVNWQNAKLARLDFVFVLSAL